MALALPEKEAKATTHPAAAFTSECNNSHESYNDPIMHYQAEDAAHLHRFWGNTSTDHNSTNASLRNNPTSTCSRGDQNAAYWVPQIRWGGQELDPVRVGTYYQSIEGLENNLTSTMPAGLRMISHPYAPWVNQGKIKWYCGRANGLIPPGTSTPPPSCPPDTDPDDGVDKNGLGVSIYFGECWDGEVKTMPEKYFVRTAVPDSSGPLRHCPGQPGDFIQIPTLVLHIDYENLPQQSGPVTVATGSKTNPAWEPHTAFHADFMNGWEQSTLQDLTTNCIRNLSPGEERPSRCKRTFP